MSIIELCGAEDVKKRQYVENMNVIKEATLVPQNCRGKASSGFNEILCMTNIKQFVCCGENSASRVLTELVISYRRRSSPLQVSLCRSVTNTLVFSIGRVQSRRFLRISVLTWQ